MTTTTTKTVAELLARAVALGHRRAEIGLDHGLHRLSRKAWDRLTLELGGFADEAELLAVRARIEASCPHLQAEVRQRARLWAQSNQDRPAPWHGFADGTGDRAAPYAERLMAGVSVEQASACVAHDMAGLVPPAWFGRLEHFAELDALHAAIDRELAALDAAVLERARLGDLAFEAGRAGFRTGHGFVGLDVGIGAIASAVAEMCRLQAVARAA